MDRLDVLRTFVAVAERASFTEAARSLRISPTAATRAVAGLERELGAALLRRTTRSVGLTAEGAAYLDRARSVLAELEDAARSIRGGNAAPRGLLVVTAPVVFGRMHIGPILTRLLQDNPDLQARFSLTDRVVRMVDEGIDVAVRIAELSDSTLHAVRVGTVRWVLAASPNYLAERSAPERLADLHRHALIAFDSFTPNGEWRFAGAGRTGIRFEPRLLTNSVDAAIDAAVDGLGIVRALSYQVVGHVAAGRLVLLLEEFAPAPVPVNLVFMANRQHSPNVRSFLDAAREYFRAPALALG